MIGILAANKIPTMIGKGLELLDAQVEAAAKSGLFMNQSQVNNVLSQLDFKQSKRPDVVARALANELVQIQFPKLSLSDKRGSISWKQYRENGNFVINSKQYMFQGIPADCRINSTQWYDPQLAGATRNNLFVQNISFISIVPYGKMHVKKVNEIYRYVLNEEDNESLDALDKYILDKTSLTVDLTQSPERKYEIYSESILSNLSLTVKSLKESGLFMPIDQWPLSTKKLDFKVQNVVAVLVDSDVACRADKEFERDAVIPAVRYIQSFNFLN